MAGKSFTAKQILFTFRESNKKTSMLTIIDGNLYTINNHLFAQVAAGNVADVTFQEKGNQLPAQDGLAPLTAFNVEDVTYTARQEKLMAIDTANLDLEEKKIKKAVKDLGDI